MNMKRVLIFAMALAFLAACNNDTEPSKPEEKKEETPAIVDNTQNPDYVKGLDLIGKSDCLTCHNVVDKLIGPSYKDVAAKYAGTSDTIVTHLANKIKAGGTGVWGETSMIPHPDLSQQDAEAMVKYILLLKK